METRGRTQDRNGDVSRDGNESSNGDGKRNADGDGNEDGIGEGGGEANKQETAVGNGGDLGGKRKNRRQKSVGSVAADPENLEISKEAGKEAQGTQGLSKNCTTRKGVFPLSRLNGSFRNKYH